MGSMMVAVPVAVVLAGGGLAGGWWWTRPAPVARPTAELDRLDGLLSHPEASPPAADRERAVRARALVRAMDLRPALLRDYRVARDSVAAVVAALAPGVAEVEARVRTRDRDAAAVRGEIVALLDRMEGVDLGESLRRTLAEARAREGEARGLFRLGRGAEAAAALQVSRGLAGEARREAHRLVDRFADEEELARWSRWIDEAVAESRRSGRALLVVDKDARTLTVYRAGARESVHAVDLGANAVAPKWRQGDRATPEGRYRVVERKDRGASRYGWALLLDYPNRDDRERRRVAVAEGRLDPGTPPGGLIEIHGSGGRGEDWTDGCVALADPEMRDLFARTPLGTPVVIVGGDGTGPWARLARELAHDR